MRKGYGHKYANNMTYLRDSPALNLPPSLSLPPPRKGISSSPASSMFLFPVTIFLNIIREMLNTNVILNLGNGKFGIVPEILRC